MEFFADEKHRPFVMGHGRIGVLALHGFMGTPAELRFLAEHLTKTADCTVYGPLLPGFGPHIEQLGDQTADTWLAHARDRWADVNRRHEKTVLIGYSMGAALAIHLATAAQPPDRLVLPAPFWRLPEWWVHALLPLVQHLKPTVSAFEMTDMDDPKMQAQLKAMAPDIDLNDPAVRDKLRQNMHIPTAVLNQLRAVGRDAYRRADQVQVPTLIIQGRQDEVVAPHLTHRLAQRLGIGAPVTLYEIESDHEFPKTHTGYLRLVSEFLTHGRRLPRAANRQ